MNRFLGWSLALFASACSVPSFTVQQDDAGVVDACVTQTAAGRLCGGACAACADGQMCDVNSDCVSGSCPAGTCTPAATCTDGLVNGAETDMDCGGGACDKCSLTLHCTRASDCQSGLCDSGVCAPMPTCSDHAINGDETDLDCGGGTFPTRPVRGTCVRASDCESGLCKAGVCAMPSADPTCSDKAKNGAETDLDCGGATCDPCAVDKRCSTGADCVTLVCVTVCQPPGCSDKVRNGDESDKDCGGSCSGCDVGLVCKTGADCKSLSCSNGHCVANTCSDKIKNGSETGLDCGGSGNGCPACPGNEGCGKTSDCQSLICTSNKCTTASCSDKVKNGTESEIDCGKGCPGCQPGQFCNSATDCASGICNQNYCVPSSPTGSVVSQSGWSATASDTAGNSMTKFAFDGDLSSRWASGAPQYADMWFQLDMGKSQIFFNLVLDVTKQPTDAPQLFDVYLSNTPTFPSLPTVKAVVGSPLTKVTFPGNKAVVARYARFVLTQNYPQAWWSIGEVTAGN